MRDMGGDDLFAAGEIVRMLVVQKDKNFRYDVDDPRRDYPVARSVWPQAFAGEVYALHKSAENWCFLCVDEKQNVIAQVWMRNSEIEYCSSENLRELLRIKLEGWQL